MQTIKSFFAPAPYGTPWTIKQITQIQANQKSGCKSFFKPEKTKLDKKREARSFAIQVLRVHFGERAFLNREATEILCGIHHSRTGLLISYMLSKNIIVKAGKPIHTDGYFYKFVK